jgi:hypothetical protein
MVTYQESAAQTHDPVTTAVDSANTWSNSSAWPNTASGHEDIHRSPLDTTTKKSDAQDEQFDIQQLAETGNKSTRIAHHAAIQRHSKVQESRRISYRNSGASAAEAQVTEKKQRVRQKNKIAAAKCRVRQRKQAQTTQAKYKCASETNAQLESYVQELRRELNGLQARALVHADCDRPIAWYSLNQANMIIAGYYSSCRGF